MEWRYGYVYIMTNKHKSVLYIGVTNDLKRRVEEHKSGKIDGFTKRYNIDTLIYAEKYEELETAITREKQLKNWSRAKKEQLIARVNPTFEEIMPF